jgi:hypothetical protein
VSWKEVSDGHNDASGNEQHTDYEIEELTDLSLESEAFTGHG